MNDRGLQAVLTVNSKLRDGSDGMVGYRSVKPSRAMDFQNNGSSPTQGMISHINVYYVIFTLFDFRLSTGPLNRFGFSYLRRVNLIFPFLSLAYVKLSSKTLTCTYG